MFKDKGGLALKRRIGESLIINNNIKITVVEIVKNTVKLCIDAPKDIRIDREEVHNKRLENE